jgi:hypothetical protein
MHLEKEQISRVFKACLDIPFDARQEDVSARKMNQFEELKRCYRQTVNEGTEPGSAWTALNSITRWRDHDRGTRGGANETEARFVSAQFGSGAAIKAKAVAYLDEMSDGELLRAAIAKTAAAKDDADLKALLARPSAVR